MVQTQRNLIDQLHCPYCGSGFEIEREFESDDIEVRYGIIKCCCYRYPVVEGVLIFKQHSSPSDNLDPVVARLDADDLEGALFRAFYGQSAVRVTRSRVGELVSLMRGFVGLATNDTKDILPELLRGAATFQEALRICKPGLYADYLFHRYANNSFIAAIPLLLLLAELGDEPCQVLDLNCGVGHASFLMQALYPHMTVVATDHDFTNLLLARRYLIPTSPCVCLDAELPLPFPNEYFTAALCMDGLHYVRSKKALLGELDRAVKQMGIWLFPHMHNASGVNINAGIPLPASGYRQCFEVIPSRLLIESQVLENFMREQSLDLSGSTSDDECQTAPVLSLVGSRTPGLWRQHRDLTGRLSQIQTAMAANPIYQKSIVNSDIHLEMVWPSRNLENECESIKQYLPQQCEIDASFWERLQAGMLLEGDQHKLDELIKSFVCVPLPKTYS